MSHWTPFFLNFFKRTELVFKFLGLILVAGYRQFFSPFFGLGGNCRFYPSCSSYAQQALEKQKLIYAIKLIGLRLCKCHPYGEYGYDPLPTIEAD